MIARWLPAGGLALLVACAGGTAQSASPGPADSRWSNDPSFDSLCRGLPNIAAPGSLLCAEEGHPLSHWMERIRSLCAEAASVETGEDLHRLQIEMRETARSIAACGYEDFCSVVDGMADPDPCVSKLPQQALSLAGPDAAGVVPSLMDVLARADRNLVWKCAGVLAAIGPDAAPAVPIILAQTARSDRDNYRKLAFALRCIGPAAVPHMMAAMHDEAPEVRSGTALMLGEMGDAARDAIPVLQEALRDEDPEVREQAACALPLIAPIGPGSIQDLVHINVETGGLVPPHVAFRSLDPRCVGPLVGLLADPDCRIRARAAELLGRQGPDARAATPALLAALEDDGCMVRSRSLQALGKIGDLRALPDLHSLVEENGSPATRAALAGLGATADVSSLIFVMGRADQALVRWAGRQLGRRDAEEIVPALASIVREDPGGSGPLAAWVLGRIGPRASAALPGLRAALADPASSPELEASAREAIGRIER